MSESKPRIPLDRISNYLEMPAIAEGDAWRWVGTDFDRALASYVMATDYEDERHTVFGEQLLPRATCLLDASQICVFARVDRGEFDQARDVWGRHFDQTYDSVRHNVKKLEELDRLTPQWAMRERRVLRSRLADLIVSGYRKNGELADKIRSYRLAQRYGAVSDHMLCDIKEEVVSFLDPEYSPKVEEVERLYCDIRLAFPDLAELVAERWFASTTTFAEARSMYRYFMTAVNEEAGFVFKWRQKTFERCLALTATWEQAALLYEDIEENQQYCSESINPFADEVIRTRQRWHDFCTSLPALAEFGQKVGEEPDGLRDMIVGVCDGARHWQDISRAAKYAPKGTDYEFGGIFAVGTFRYVFTRALQKTVGASEAKDLVWEHAGGNRYSLARLPGVMIAECFYRHQVR